MANVINKKGTKRTEVKEHEDYVDFIQEKIRKIKVANKVGASSEYTLPFAEST